MDSLRRVSRAWTPVAACLLLLAAPARAGVGVWTSGGPAGQFVTALAMDPSKATTIYAGTVDGAIFRTTDGGNSWLQLTRTTTADQTVFDLALATSSTLYAGLSFREGTIPNQAGVVRSTDSGKHWNAVGLDMSAVSSLTIDPTTASTIYAGTSDALPTHTAGIQKTTDGGATWNLLTNMAWGISALVLDPQRPATIYATGQTGDFDYPDSALIRSIDGGKTWDRPLFSECGNYIALAVDPKNPQTLYVGDTSPSRETPCDGILKSTDGGTNWQPANVGLQGSDPFRPSVSAIVIDPVSPQVLYAGTNRGVFRSGDGGSSWSAFNDGLSDHAVQTMVIDPTGRFLHAATRSGVFDIEIEGGPPPVVEGCSPGADHLCLLGTRFRVDLEGTDPHGAPFTPAALPQGPTFGYFSFPALTGDPTLPEVFVKMIDATSLPGQGFWFFYSGLTSVTYSLTVTDTETGEHHEYGTGAFCGGSDTGNFLPGSAASVGRTAASASPLRASGNELSLLTGRFRIALSATDPRTHVTASGVAIPQADRYGYFSLPSFTGDPNLPEVFVKMIDATSLPGGAFWVFHTGLTDLPYTVTVTDSVTGRVRNYQNDRSDPIHVCGGADTQAFPE